MATLPKESEFDKQKAEYKCIAKVMGVVEMIGIILVIVGLVMTINNDDEGPGPTILYIGFTIMLLACIILGYYCVRNKFIGFQQGPRV